MTTNLIPVASWFDTDNKTLLHTTISPKSDGQIFHEARHPIEGCRAPTPEIRVKLLHPDALPPTRGHATDAGMDLYAYEDVVIEPFGSTIFHPESGVIETYRVLVPTGIAISIPHGLGLFIWDRSGLSAKHGQHRVAGVVDSNYTGEIKVALVNLSTRPYHIKKGDRIAQAVITPIILPRIIIVDDLNDTSRGSGGFGSTGA